MAAATEVIVFQRWLSDLGGVRGSMQRFMPEQMPAYRRMRFEAAYLKLCEAYEQLVLGSVDPGPSSG